MSCAGSLPVRALGDTVRSDSWRVIGSRSPGSATRGPQRLWYRSVRVLPDRSPGRVKRPTNVSAVSTFPQRSTGVLLSPMGDRAVAYDLLTETAHQLNGSAGTLLAACDGEGDIDEAVTVWADGASVDGEAVATDVAAGLDMLEELTLVGRDEPVVAPKPVVGSTADARDDDLVGAVHPVIDHNIAFRGPDQHLLDTLDEFLGTGTDAEKPTMFFDAHEDDDGQLVLVTDYEWKFPSLEACLRQLTSVVNEYAVWPRQAAPGHRASSDMRVATPADDAGEVVVGHAAAARQADAPGDSAPGEEPVRGSIEHGRRTGERALLVHRLPGGAGLDVVGIQVEADVLGAEPGNRGVDQRAGQPAVAKSVADLGLECHPVNAAQHLNVAVEIPAASGDAPVQVLQLAPPERCQQVGQPVVDPDLVVLVVGSEWGLVPWPAW